MKHISGKELNYINDVLSWELLAAKKCNQYAYQQNNTNKQQVFFDAARTHQQNYFNVLSYISQTNNTKGGH